MDYVRKLRSLWWVAFVVGVISFALGLLWVNSSGGPGLDWIWGVAAFGLGVVLFNVAFFILCSIFASSLSSRVEDDTEVDGDTVVHVVRHQQSGHEPLDFYIRAYATARATTAVAITIVVMGSLAVYFF